MSEPQAPQPLEPSGNLWTFDNVVLDERRRELTVDGELVEIERKALEVLMFLLRHPGEVVTKDELLEAVWPGRVLTDSAVARSVSRAREALRDRNQNAIKTVRGFGYQFIAEVKVERSKIAGPSKLNLREGDHPPLRPLWSLTEKLGAGGQGEAWLVRHDKTKELRVFKFSVDMTGLSALKREITISRYLKDALGSQDCFLNITDWNLEEAPYFLESAYIASGNLEQWARTFGGIDKLPLPVRIEIAARIADALALAHSVGVLHKDIKPSNILVEARHGDEVPRIQLADFGSGGLLNAQQLENMGITRLGFTHTIASESTAGTPLYLAPEIIGGQPCTVQSDIYALGVVLFQIAVGDFDRPPASGWEARIEDPLLREDIALAMAGDPKERITAAADLVTRLRTLDERQAQLESETQEKLDLQHQREQAEQLARKAELDTVRLRSRRFGLAFAFCALTAGLIFSTWQYTVAERARVREQHAAETNKAVATFLSDDLFAQVTDKPLRDLSVKELLDSASESLESRFSDLPAAEAQLHAALGRAYWKMELFESAKTHFELALQGFSESGLLGSDDAVDMAAEYMLYLAGSGNYAAAEALYTRVHRAIVIRAGDLTQATNSFELHRAWTLLMAGRWPEAAKFYQNVIQQIESRKNPDPLILGKAETQLGYVQTRLGRHALAEETLTRAKARLIKRAGPQSSEVANATACLGRGLLEAGLLNEAQVELSEALDIYSSWTSIESSALQSSVEATLALIKLRRGDHKAAIQDLQRVLGAVDAWNYSAEFQTWLAEAYDLAGELDLAEQMSRKALIAAESLDGPRHPLSQVARIQLANIIRRSQNPESAFEVLRGIDSGALEIIGAVDPLMLSYHRTRGLIYRDRGNLAEAEQQLNQALVLAEKIYGPKHSTTSAIQSEFANLNRGTVASY